MLAWAVAPALAGNGLNVIGFGAESAIMGGADVAVARDTTALATNPAGLSQLERSRLDLNVAPTYIGRTRHRDPFNDDARVDNPLTALAGFGYARPIAGTRWTAGIGFFAQGGSGFVYDELTTAFGTRDELSTLFGIVKLSPGVAYRVNERLSLGASLGLVYATNKQTFFPDTSVVDAADPARSFFGVDMRGLKSFNAGLKIGAHVRVNDAITLGAQYTSRIKLPLEDGRMTLDMTAAGLGKVQYRDVEVQGFGLPQELSLGIALRPRRDLLLAAELTWLDWSRAARSTTLRARKPDNAAAPATVEQTARLGWRDQVVVSLGAVLDIGDQQVLRAGINYGRSPIPQETLNPLLPLITERHVAVGYGRRLSSEWEFSTGLEWDLPVCQRYTNPNLPFGTDAEECINAVVWHVMWSRRWQ